MISKKLLIFILLFMIFEYILLITEWIPYLNMYSDIQGYKYNWFKTEGKLDLMRTLIFSWGYFIMMWGFEIIVGNKLYTTNASSLSIIIWLWSTWGFAYYIMLKKANNHVRILLYDFFVTGVICIILTQFVFNKFYKILEKNIPILGLLYFVTMILFFYVCYKYNPDLSNINGIYNIYHFLTMVVIFSIASYILLKLK
jgi:hypothetical protein